MILQKATKKTKGDEKTEFRWMEFQVPVISLNRSQVPLSGAGDQVGCAVRPVVRRSWVEIRAIGPNQRVGFGGDAHFKARGRGQPACCGGGRF